MSCNRATTVLHGYFDSELDALGAAEFEHHLEQCFDCISALDALESLRSFMNMARLREKAPAQFRKKVLADLRPGRPVVVFPGRTPWRWLAVAAAFLLVAYGSWRVIPIQRGSNYETVLAAEIVDAHLRSLQPGHLTDVVSTDQGFPLQGGRIDVVHGRSVAALVYARRKHFVNVFVWPTNEQDAAPRSGSQQGYQWIAWRKGGMEFCAVSDAAPSALEQLQRLFTE
jgi:anti-sigma factor RsiW